MHAHSNTYRKQTKHSSFRTINAQKCSIFTVVRETFTYRKPDTEYPAMYMDFLLKYKVSMAVACPATMYNKLNWCTIKSLVIIKNKRT